jgi:hypothetical protein
MPPRRSAAAPNAISNATRNVTRAALQKRRPDGVVGEPGVAEVPARPRRRP